MKLKILSDTVFKQTSEQSNLLPDSEKVSVAAGTDYPLHSYSTLGDHVRIALEGESLKGRNTWFAFKPHVEVVKDDGTKAIGKYTINDKLPTTVKLPVPYFSQRDNRYRPSGTCNVTSVAMCLYYFGVRPQNKGQQLEDELFKAVESRGWSRHTHDDLRRLFKVYDMNDIFKVDASWQEVKCHLANGNPIIYSGKFTQYGHIIVIRGYDEKGWFVNDPWGEYTAAGYINKSGENLHYSYGLLSRLSYGGSSATWAHFPSKPQ